MSKETRVTAELIGLLSTLSLYSNLVGSEKGIRIQKILKNMEAGLIDPETARKQAMDIMSIAALPSNEL